MRSINTTLPTFPSVFRDPRISHFREKVGCSRLDWTVTTWGECHSEYQTVISLGSFPVIHFLVGEHFQRGIFSSWKYKEYKASRVDGVCLTPWSWHSDSCTFSRLHARIFQPGIMSAPKFFNRWDQHEHQRRHSQAFTPMLEATGQSLSSRSGWANEEPPPSCLLPSSSRSLPLTEIRQLICSKALETLKTNPECWE